MSLALLGFPTIVLAKIGPIEIDVVRSESHDFAADISSNPIEDGTPFSDHVVLRPVVVTMQGRITDASMITLDLRSPGRAIEAYRALVQLQTSREPFTLVTGINVYENMLIQSISFPRTSNDGQSIRFSAVMQELLVVGDEASINRERIAEDVRHTALPVENLGIVPKVAV